MGKIYYSTPNADYYFYASNKMIRVIEFASRICYDAGDKITEDSWYNYIMNRVKSGHESVTEHGIVSVIIDLTKMDNEIEQKQIIDIENVFAGMRIRNTYDNSIFTFRTKLHYCCEPGWNKLSPESHMMIISGNVKMWRDFIKAYIATGHFHGNVTISILDTVIELFRFYDHMGWGGIFTSDIPELIANSNLVKSCKTLLYPGTGLQHRIDDPELIPLVNLNFCDMIYAQRPRDVSELTEDEINNNINIDFGTTSRLISCDNIPTDMLLFNKVVDIPYFTQFIQAHILYISSVTYWIRMPRIVSQQEARHRENSISQRSQRYVNEFKKPGGVYVPDSIKNSQVREYNTKTNVDKSMEDIYLEMVNEAFKCYDKLVSSGIPKEDARNILPGGVYTQMVVTKPFYTLPHYFKERTSKAAQFEIREPAIALKKYLNDKFSYIKDGRPLFE